MPLLKDDAGGAMRVTVRCHERTPPFIVAATPTVPVRFRLVCRTARASATFTFRRHSHVHLLSYRAPLCLALRHARFIAPAATRRLLPCCPPDRKRCHHAVARRREGERHGVCAAPRMFFSAAFLISHEEPQGYRCVICRRERFSFLRRYR